jgi:hypothetical protein
LRRLLPSFALRWRNDGRAERLLGVATTARNWNTLGRLARVAEG